MIGNLASRCGIVWCGLGEVVVVGIWLEEKRLGGNQLR